MEKKMKISFIKETGQEVHKQGAQPAVRRKNKIFSSYIAITSANLKLL